MQIEIHLTPCDDRILDFNYHHELSAALYQALSKESQTLSSRLHDGDFRSRLKLFVFSPLSSMPKPELAESEHCRGLRFGSHVWMRFGSPVPEILFGMSEALLAQRSLNVRGKQFKVDKIDMVKTPAWTPVMTYRPFGQSGMLLCRYEQDGRVLCQTPDNPHEGVPDCAALLVRNLRHKLYRLGEVRPDLLDNLLALSDLNRGALDTLPIRIELLNLTPDRAFRTGSYTIKGIPMRGFRAPVRITAPEAVQRVVWDCGCGSQNSQGFGLMTTGKQE